MSFPDAKLRKIQPAPDAAFLAVEVRAELLGFEDAVAASSEGVTFGTSPAERDSAFTLRANYPSSSDSTRREESVQLRGGSGLRSATRHRGVKSLKRHVRKVGSSSRT